MILVTGATGLLGSHVVIELLQRGKKVRALKRAGSDVASVEKIFSHYGHSIHDLFKNINWVEGDVTDFFSLLDALENVEYVYHCAAHISFGSGDEKLLMKINAEGTANLVNACLEINTNLQNSENRQIKKLCHVSSVAALGRADNDKIISEENKWKVSNNNSAYAVSKYCAEREVWRGTEEGLDAIIVNPCIIIGPGNSEKSSGRMIESVWNGLKFYTKGGNAFIDVRDVAKIMVQLTESDVKNERFILSSENLKFKNVFEMIAASLKKPAPFIQASALLSGLAWRAEYIKSLFSGTKPFITRETAMTGQQHNYYNNEKIKNKLKNEFIPVREAIENSCSFFLKTMEPY